MPFAAVLYTIKEVVGEAMGREILLVAKSCTRGINKPKLLETISSIAEGSGAAPVAFIPMFCDFTSTTVKQMKIKKSIRLFMHRKYHTLIVKNMILVSLLF